MYIYIYTHDIRHTNYYNQHYHNYTLWLFNIAMENGWFSH